MLNFQSVFSLDICYGWQSRPPSINFFYFTFHILHPLPPSHFTSGLFRSAPYAPIGHRRHFFAPRFQSLTNLSFFRRMSSCLVPRHLVTLSAFSYRRHPSALAGLTLFSTVLPISFTLLPCLALWGTLSTHDLPDHFMRLPSCLPYERSRQPLPLFPLHTALASFFGLVAYSHPFPCSAALHIMRHPHTLI